MSRYIAGPVGSLQVFDLPPTAVPDSHRGEFFHWTSGHWLFRERRGFLVEFKNVGGTRILARVAPDDIDAPLAEIDAQIAKLTSDLAAARADRQILLHNAAMRGDRVRVKP